MNPNEPYHVVGRGNIPLVASIPHSSLHIPESLRESFLVSPEDLRRELLLVTDRFTDELYALPTGNMSGIAVVFDVCRVIVDPERFEDDTQEANAAFGRGVVYVKTLEGKPLRKVSFDDRESLLSIFYRPFHEALNAQVENALNRFGSCLFLDCHSFPSKPLTYESDYKSSLKRPDICIGTDDRHSPDDLVRKVEAYFKSNGLEVCINNPYQGTLVPTPYYRRNADVSALMIEINRSLYMNEETGQKTDGFTRTQELVAGLLKIVF